MTTPLTSTRVAANDADVFLGFRAKEPWKPAPSWWPEGAGQVQRVCSVSDCLSKPPDEWRARWDFNRAGCFDTEAAAQATIPGERAGDFELFAYWMVPVRTDANGQRRAISPTDLFTSDLEALPEEGDTEGYVPIGYDVVAIEANSYGFTCSPLSCCSMASEVPVNRYCLIDDLAAALRTAQRFDAEQPEPGDYYVVRIAMKVRGEVPRQVTQP